MFAGLCLIHLSSGHPLTITHQVPPLRMCLSVVWVSRACQGQGSAGTLMILHRKLPQKTQTLRDGAPCSWVEAKCQFCRGWHWLHTKAGGPKRWTGSCIVYKSYFLPLVAVNQHPANTWPRATGNPAREGQVWVTLLVVSKYHLWFSGGGWSSRVEKRVWDTICGWPWGVMGLQWLLDHKPGPTGGSASFCLDPPAHPGEPPALLCLKKPTGCSSPSAGARKGGKALFLRKNCREHKDKDNPLGGIQKLQTSHAKPFCRGCAEALDGAGCHCSGSQWHLWSFFTPCQALGSLNRAHCEAIGS